MTAAFLPMTLMGIAAFGSLHENPVTTPETTITLRLLETMSIAIWGVQAGVPRLPAIGVSALEAQSALFST